MEMFNSSPLSFLVFLSSHYKGASPAILYIMRKKARKKDKQKFDSKRSLLISLTPNIYSGSKLSKHEFYSTS